MDYLNLDVKDMIEDPELFKAFLKDIVHHTSLCGRFVETDCNVPDKRFDHINVFFQNQFKSLLLDLIDNMWSTFDITAKRLYLNKLEKSFPPNYVAWCLVNYVAFIFLKLIFRRPTTGEIPITILEGNNLTFLKNLLRKKIDGVNQKAELLKKEILKKSELIEKSVKEIAKYEKISEGINNDYQSIIHSCDLL
ncbi:hypothetical protein FQA39_LY10757 [Lamprigera yunnana]|nr:hypothetical protein FQA39_LY10757 [Lamprigera yunnana]